MSLRYDLSTMKSIGCLIKGLELPKIFLITGLHPVSEFGRVCCLSLRLVEFVP